MILTPGDHCLPSGEPERVSNYQFAERVYRELIACMERDAINDSDLVPRAPIPGIFRMQDSPFTLSVAGDVLPFDTVGARHLIGKHIILQEFPRPKANAEVTPRDVPCSMDLASIVSAYAAVEAQPVRSVVRHRCYTRTGKRLDRGFHLNEGVLVTRPAPFVADVEREPLSILDLAHDFGLDPISAAHYIALGLTILFRPLLDGNSPMFVINAPMERSGKTKSIQDIYGMVIFGAPIPTWKWPTDDDELMKQLVAKLRGGHSVLLIDNVPSKLDSDTLASVITSRAISGRILGKSEDRQFTNNLTIVVTGNHVECSQEIARRSLVVNIDPRCDSPELRTGFRHPDLIAASSKLAQRVLAWFDQLIQAWVAAGSPRCGKPFGGFERWMDTVGSIMHFHGYPLMAERTAELAAINPDGGELERFIERWELVHGNRYVDLADLLTTARDAGDIWPEVFTGPNERSHLMSLGKRIAKAVGRVTLLENGERVTVVKHSSGSSRRYALVYESGTI